MTETTRAQMISAKRSEEQRNLLNHRLDKIILKAVDKSLSSFGLSFKQAFYFQLQKNYNLKKEEIPQRIREFTVAIEELFGISAKFLEAKIIESLHDQIPSFMHFPKGDDLILEEYVKNLRAVY